MTGSEVRARPLALLEVLFHPFDIALSAAVVPASGIPRADASPLVATTVSALHPMGERALVAGPQPRQGIVDIVGCRLFRSGERLLMHRSLDLQNPIALPAWSRLADG